MVVEPIGTALAVAGLLQPLFSTCRALYNGYQLTQSFGDDFNVAQRRLYIQYARLEGISQKKLVFLKNKFEPWDRDHPITKAIICQLVLIKTHFQECNTVLKKYHDLEQEATETPDNGNSAGAGDPRPEAGPSDSNPQTILPVKEENLALSDLRSPSPAESSRSRSRLHREWRKAFSWKDKSRNALKLASSSEDTSSGATTPLARGGDTQGRGSGSTESRRDFSTPATTVSPPILEATSIQEDASKQDFQAKRVQNSIQFLRRVVWAADDKNLIFTKIQELRESNDELESLLEYRPPGNALDIMGSPDLPTPIQNLSDIQTSVNRLHEALASLNGSKGAKQMYISVQLRADCRGISEELPEENDISLREGSYMFLLHVHGLCDSHSPHRAIELLAETPSNTHARTQAIPLIPLTSLSDLERAIESNSDENDYKQVGTVERKASPSEVHQFLSTNQRNWYRVNDLYQVLDTEDFRDKLNPIQRIQLASLIAITHLYFAKIRVSSTEVSPSNFTYYNMSSNAVTWDDYEPFILNPFISIGFGSRKPLRNLGASSGRPKQKNNVVAELGLLLHQIGSSSKIEYGQGPEGFRRAKEQALQSIHAVENGAGSRYAEVAQMCLEWKPSCSYAGPGDEDWRVIQGVVAWLKVFEDKLGLS